MGRVALMADDEVRALELRVTALERRDAVDEVHHTNITGRLDAIEDTLKWIVRLIIGGFILAIVAYVVNGGVAV